MGAGPWLSRGGMLRWWASAICSAHCMMSEQSSGTHSRLVFMFAWALGAGRLLWMKVDTSGKRTM